MYSEHLANIHVGKVRAASSHGLSQQAEAMAPELLDGVNRVCSVVWEHRATDDSQLSLKVGDCVKVRQITDHGWVYGKLVDVRLAGGASEGWFPSFCLPEKAAPPKPQAAPPPMSSPETTTQVARNYVASDPAQLSVTKGELVKIRQRDQSGWTFVVRVSTLSTGKREGWVPDWLLQHES